VAATSSEVSDTRPGGVGAAGFELHGPSTPVSRLLADLWAARRVLAVLARKDFYARYRRTSLGLLWAVGLPLVQAAVLAVVFTRVVHLGNLVNRTNGHVSFPVFLYAGLTAWSYFATNMPPAATAIVDNAGLAGKIYFPRALFPLLVVTTGLYPLVIGTGVLFAMTLALEHHVGVDFLLVLPAMALTVAITAGLGLVLSALHVYFRDIRFVVQAVMSVLFYLSPVIYSLNAAPGALGHVVSYGPMAGPIELFRLATAGADDGWGLAVLGGVGWFVVTAAIGLVLQSRNDRVFVDLL
jgi:ABC-type polysaccharide/polyol phosphate export permease